MPFGIIFDGEAPKQEANFYIPLISQLSTNTVSGSHTISVSPKASHVYLGSAPRPVITEVLRTTEKTVLVELQHPVSEFIAFIKGCTGVTCQRTHKLAVVAPLSDDLDLFGHLKHSYLPLVLRYDLPISNTSLQLFKCLNYSAILVANDFKAVNKEQVSLLLTKSSTPSLITFQNHVHDPHEWQLLAKPHIPPFSDLLITPLQPLVQDLPLSVYEEFEKDSTKYMQYHRAISMALNDLHDLKKTIKVLVVGPGRGPLLKMVMECACVQDTIVIVEKNPQCLPLLQTICAQNSKVSLIHGDCRQLPNLESYDLVVSELLGSFGCNEACPEILNFPSDAVFIPESFSNFIHPIYSDTLGEVSKKAVSAGDALYAGGLSLSAVPPSSSPNHSTASSLTTQPFLTRLNSLYSPCDPQEIFEFFFPGKNALNQKQTVFFPGCTGVPANALCGYFQATLYGPYRIGIGPEVSKGETCESWFPIIFPINEIQYPVTVEMLRCSTHYLQYKYTVNGQTYITPEFGLDSSAKQAVTLNQ